MVFDSNMASAHGTHHQAGRWLVGRRFRIHAKNGLGQGNRGVKSSFARKSVASRTRRQMLRKWILDDFQQRCRFCARFDLHFVQELYHQAGKTFVGAWDSNTRMHINQYFGLCLNIYFDESCFGSFVGYVTRMSPFGCRLANVCSRFQ